MRNWITTRKVARTEAPNYPVRAAQTVDAVVNRWIPAVAALLACTMTPARAKLDARYYEAPNYPVRAVQTVDATVRTWIPVFDAELASERVCQRPPLDVRRYEWAPETFDIVTRVDAQVRTWQPAFDAERDSRRPPERAALDVRRYDWDAPDTAWITATLPAGGPTVAQTSPAFADKGGRTAARQPLDVRTYDWAIDETNWLQVPLSDLAHTIWPALVDRGDRTRDQPRLDVRSYDWSPDEGAWIVRNLPTGPSVAQTAPAWANQDDHYRTGPDPTAFDLFRTQASPDIFGVPDDWITWAPQQDDGGGRTRDRARLDVRAYEWSQPAWIFTSLPSAAITTAQAWPAVLDKGTSYRTPARPALDVRGYDWQPAFSWVQPVVDAVLAPWAGLFDTELDSARTRDRDRLDVRRYDWQPDAGSWLFVNLPPAVTTAQQWPAILDKGAAYRTPARPSLDVRAYDWAPIFDWAQPVVDATVRTWIPAFAAELASVRTAARRQDSITTEPLPAWVFASLPPDASIAQQIGALIQAAGLSYRTPERAKLDVRADYWAPAFGWQTFAADAAVAKWTGIFEHLHQVFRTAERPRLDVRAYDWAPESGWLPKVVDAVLAKWLPIWAAEVGVRTPDHALLDVRGLTSAPELAWLAPVIVFVPPPSVDPVEFFVVSAEDRWFIVAAVGRWFEVDA